MNNRIKDALQGNPISSKVAVVSGQFAGRVYLVGGMVRDIIMGRETDLLDIDIAVDGDPAELGKILSKALGAHLFPISREFYTWRVVSDSDSKNRFTIDITPLRDVSIEGDLLERDFSINSIAIDLSSFSEGEYIRLIDPRNGINDISAHLIRSGDSSPFERDPVRLIRALRFENVLGFNIEEHTARFIKEKAELIRDVSGERIRDEIVQVFHKGQADSFFKRLDSFGLLNILFPGLSGEGGKNQFALISRVESLLATPPVFLSDYSGEISAYFETSIGDGFLKADILKLSSFIAGYPGVYSTSPQTFTERLKMGNKGEGLLKLSLSNHILVPEEGSLERRDIYHLLSAGGDAAIIKLLLSIAGEEIERGEDLPQNIIKGYQSIFKFYFNEYKLREKPLLNGEDVMSHLNISPGPEVGKLLKLVEEEYIVGNISSREDALGYIEGGLLYSPFRKGG
ncbi:MAG: hypothetical protein KKC21_02880 [Nitrospinae bacterium]|nr:hypothetical protein [Nitrospinota bacterium]